MAPNLQAVMLHIPVFLHKHS